MTETVTIEDIIKTLPITIHRTVKDVCSCCGRKIEKELLYTLQIRVQRYYGENKPTDRYHAFYLCGNRPSGDPYRYIGIFAGLGNLTLKEALSNLKHNPEVIKELEK